MSEHRHFDPGSDLEDEGIPDLQDGTPMQELSEDPNQLPVPDREPSAVDEWGTTPEEEQEGEPLSLQLSREEPDIGPEDATEPRGDEDVPYDAAQSPPEHAGRIVAPDEGTGADTEKDDVASDVGADGGGFLPEELAMRTEEPGNAEGQA